ncbi:MAG: valine--tRNA ligase [Planctomycetes bacterium]|jgi:valyl-tRNA synthetase|nr:valine--tRNA ligase [Planctomycetota bacterium]MDP6408732.1 valine--tRNA ligase [Planctomycetota bacterium]
MELATRYQADEHEREVYRRWEESGGFQPRPDPTGADRRFTIMIPPPNVTGALHMGHALNGTIQDIVIRHRRMCGFEALWLPGTDHAGIATQAVVEKKLFEERGQKRKEMGREAFLKEIWAWREEYGSRIYGQYRRLGASCDWSRTAFTMDPELKRAVRESFVRLWERGLVYRGYRMINWDCVLQTAISDDEIEHVARKTKLWHLRYPIEGSPGEFLVVATTRPETMLGDTAVAVHPDDERYRSLVGRHCVLPILERRIPIIADESVEAGFGTGAVKVTPAHDKDDYERGQRHELEMINVLELDGRINENGGPYAGLSREQARKEIVQRFEELELLDRIEDHEHNVALSDRSKDPVEPLLSHQWFVKMKPLAGPAIKAVTDGELTFVPSRWSKTYLQWLENVHDWCISRQLWWGHRIPVWYDEDGVPVASREDLELGSPHPETGKPIVHQDEDVLDTWASSWLWPFATLGWPERTEDLERYFPTQFLSTGRDIIYLWVARMIMAGYEFCDDASAGGRCAFAVCNVHATILDAKGRRMSKSAGNGIDPIDMIDEYGADAVRYSLILLTKEGQDTKLAPEKLEQGYRFGNKVWNAARFVLMNLGGERSWDGGAGEARVEDRWIRSRLSAVLASTSEALEQYRLNDAAMGLYRFVWNDFCDWYLELAKPRFLNADDPSGAEARATLERVLRDILAMLHPFTPYMTEVLWGSLHESLGVQPPEMLMNSAWPDGEGLEVDAEAEAAMELVRVVVGAVRQVRHLTLLDERSPLAAILVVADEGKRASLTKHGAAVRALAHLESYEVCESAERPAASAVAVAAGLQIFVPLGEGVDLGGLCGQLSRRLEKVEKGIAGVDGKLANERFLQNAEPSVIEGERERRGELEREAEMLRGNLAGL